VHTKKTPKPSAIKKAREDAGLTQRQAAYLIGYSERTWQEWESGRQKMRPALFASFRSVVAGP